MGGGIQTDTLAITPEILRLIAEIDEFKGAWAAIGRISPDRLTALRRRCHDREHRFIDPYRRSEVERPGGRTPARPDWT